MSARDTILTATKANQPEISLLPEIDLQAVISYEDVVAQFITVLQGIGGKVVPVTNINGVKNILAAEMQEGKYIVNTMPVLGEVDPGLGALSAQQLAGVDKVFARGTIGVAENGAVWICEKNMCNRLLPFICQHLVLVVDKKDIVHTMHHAYQRINVFEEGFGVFIAGPSKTADIEQSLVIGAHGARSLVLYLIG